MPDIIPIPMGNRNFILCLGVLKILLISYRHLSYRFNNTKRILPDRPGVILKIPAKKPFIKFFIIHNMKTKKKRAQLFYELLFLNSNSSFDIAMYNI